LMLQWAARVVAAATHLPARRWPSSRAAGSFAVPGPCTCAVLAACSLAGHHHQMTKSSHSINASWAGVHSLSKP
jgi:hypothetical protein